jgi:hypothetical protein
MRRMIGISQIRRASVLAWVLLAASAFGQSTPGSASNSKVSIESASLPPATPQQEYHFQLVGSGGIPPLKWQVVQGDLPTGMKLNPNGLISGTPGTPGDFHFVVSVSDESQPALTANREFTLKVVQALLLEWKNYPRLSGNQILGSAAVSNGTTDTFDFTFFVVAVNEIGKAFALGYQRFALKPGTSSFEIAFGQQQNLPQGAYTVHVDGVGELDEKGLIYHRRLQTKEPLSIAVGP